VVSELISVVIPYYKHFEYIESTIQSVLEQTYRNFELIVVDDGSNDGENDVLEGLLLKYKFKLIRKENGGVSSALNRGIMEAEGDYIAVIGSDDMMKPTRLEKQIECLELNPEIAACATYVERIDADDKYLNSKNPMKPGRYGFNYFYSNDFYFPAPSAMYKKSALLEVGLFSVSEVIEDWDMLLKLTSKRYKLYLIGECLTYYRIHASTSNRYIYMYKGILSVAKKYKGKYYFKFLKIRYYQGCRFMYKSFRSKRYNDVFRIIRVVLNG
jgi:glycosyltransferase involved in cell wall biosynthesis